MFEILIYVLTISTIILGGICYRLYDQIGKLKGTFLSNQATTRFTIEDHRNRLTLLEQKMDLIAKHCNVEFKRQPARLVIEDSSNK